MWRTKTFAAPQATFSTFLHVDLDKRGFVPDTRTNTLEQTEWRLLPVLFSVAVEAKRTIVAYVTLNAGLET